MSWIEEIDAILGNTLEPRYLTWVDARGVRHVEIEQISHVTTYVKQGNKLVPSFDSQEGILLGVTREL